MALALHKLVEVDAGRQLVRNEEARLPTLQVADSPASAQIQIALRLNRIEHLLDCGTPITSVSTYGQRIDLGLKVVNPCISLVQSRVELVRARVQVVHLKDDVVDDLLHIDVDRLLQVTHTELEVIDVIVDLRTIAF